MLERFGLSEDLLWWVVVISAAVFLAGMLALPWLLSRIPHDYFLTHPIPLAAWKASHPIARWCLLIVRNLLGVILVLLGVVMLFTPGQGIITLLLGVSLMTFPGKRQLEMKLIRMRGVHKAINWIRAKAGHRPLLLPGEPEQTPGD